MCQVTMNSLTLCVRFPRVHTASLPGRPTEESVPKKRPRRPLSGGHLGGGRPPAGELPSQGGQGSYLEAMEPRRSAEPPQFSKSKGRGLGFCLHFPGFGWAFSGTPRRRADLGKWTVAPGQKWVGLPDCAACGPHTRPLLPHSRLLSAASILPPQKR